MSTPPSMPSTLSLILSTACWEVSTVFSSDRTSKISSTPHVSSDSTVSSRSDLLWAYVVWDCFLPLSVLSVQVQDMLVRQREGARPIKMTVMMKTSQGRRRSMKTSTKPNDTRPTEILLSTLWSQSDPGIDGSLFIYRLLLSYIKNTLSLLPHPR